MNETTPSLSDAFRVWLRIGLLSFGGPAGQIALMHRMLVEERRWIDERRFMHALNFCMLLPGPEAQQLATYVGWMLHRIPGALLAGLLFILPGALAMLLLSITYALYGETGLMTGVFFGLKAAVLAIVVQALLRLASRTLRSRSSQLLALSGFCSLYLFGLPFPLVVISAALIGLLLVRLGVPGLAAESHGDAPSDPATVDLRPVRSRPLLTAGVTLSLWLGPLLALYLVLGPTHVFTELAAFFAKLAVLSFGGAYAVLAWVAQAAVDSHGWMSPGEMLDGLGLAETTPGPLILVTQFVGFLAAFREPGGLPPLIAGSLGALLVTWMTFAPCFLWILLGAPFMERLRANRALSAALAAITAVVVGVIANLALWFSVNVLFSETFTLQTGLLSVLLPLPSSVDPWALLLAAAALLATLRWGIGVLPLLGVAASAGVILQWVGLV